MSTSDVMLTPEDHAAARKLWQEIGPFRLGTLLQVTEAFAHYRIAQATQTKEDDAPSALAITNERIDQAIEFTYREMDNFLPRQGESWETCFKRRLKANLCDAVPAPIERFVALTDAASVARSYADALTPPGIVSKGTPDEAYLTGVADASAAIEDAIHALLHPPIDSHIERQPFDAPFEDEPQ